MTSNMEQWGPPSFPWRDEDHLSWDIIFAELVKLNRKYNGEFVNCVVRLRAVPKTDNEGLYMSIEKERKNGQ